MKSFSSATSLLALALTAGYAAAQSMDTKVAADSNGIPMSATPGSYYGTDTNGHRVDVQAPYGGKSQHQADAKEAPLTNRLNEQALQNAMPQPK